MNRAGAGRIAARAPVREAWLDRIVITGGARLEGVIPISGAKNSAIKLMVASLLTDQPLRLTNLTEAYNFDATIDGGGVSGQAGAMRLGIARSLLEIDPELRPALKKAGLLTRDAREKESKKYGLKKARKAPQYSKR